MPKENYTEELDTYINRKYQNKNRKNKKRNHNMLSNSNYRLFIEYAKKVPRDQIIGSFDQDGNFFLYNQEQKLIQKTYKIFYINTL